MFWKASVFLGRNKTDPTTKKWWFLLESKHPSEPESSQGTNLVFSACLELLQDHCLAVVSQPWTRVSWWCSESLAPKNGFVFFFPFECMEIYQGKTPWMCGFSSFSFLKKWAFIGMDFLWQETDGSSTVPAESSGKITRKLFLLFYLDFQCNTSSREQETWNDCFVWIGLVLCIPFLKYGSFFKIGINADFVFSDAKVKDFFLDILYPKVKDFFLVSSL